MDVHPTKNGINRYWYIPTSLDEKTGGFAPPALLFFSCWKIFFAAMQTFFKGFCTARKEHMDANGVFQTLRLYRTNSSLVLVSRSSQEHSWLVGNQNHNQGLGGSNRMSKSWGSQNYFLRVTPQLTYCLTFYLAFYLTCFLTFYISDIYSDIISGTLSGILSGIYFGILSEIICGILSDQYLLTFHPFSLACLRAEACPTRSCTQSWPYGSMSRCASCIWRSQCLKRGKKNEKKKKLHLC